MFIFSKCPGDCISMMQCARLVRFFHPLKKTTSSQATRDTRSECLLRCSLLASGSHEHRNKGSIFYHRKSNNGGGKFKSWDDLSEPMLWQSHGISNCKGCLPYLEWWGWRRLYMSNHHWCNMKSRKTMETNSEGVRQCRQAGKPGEDWMSRWGGSTGYSLHLLIHVLAWGSMHVMLCG